MTRLARWTCRCALVALAAHAVPAMAAATRVEIAVVSAAPTVESDPVAHTGDAADDPAIWVDRANPAHSAVIGNDKLGALEVYDLTGKRIQRISEGFFGNVDVRAGFPSGRGSVDLVVVYRLGIRVYAIDPNTRHLSNITDSASGSIPVSIPGEGLCTYRSSAGRWYVFTNARDGRYEQYELTDIDKDGRVEGTLRRSWDVGTETEGCVVDDTTGVLYASEENVGIWQYDADPYASASGSSRSLVDATIAKGGHIRPDAEGLTIVRRATGAAYLVASSQAASDTRNSFLVYRIGTNDFVGEFQVVAGPGGDGCGRTDGIDAVSTNLGPAFPNGLFVCQDGQNTTPSAGRQNFKFVPLDRILVGL